MAPRPRDRRWFRPAQPEAPQTGRNPRFTSAVASSRRRGLALGLALLGSAALLSGCVPWAKRGPWDERTPVVLFLAIATLRNESVDRDTTERFQNGFRETLRRFQQIHPNVVVRVAVYPEQLLQLALRRRQHSGFGPDLIATTAEQAHALSRHGLLEPIPLGPEQHEAIEPSLLQRVSDGKGRIFAQPLLMLAQLSCYDTRRLPRPPTTMRELLEDRKSTRLNSSHSSVSRMPSSA